jgi:hypothetical protein
MRGGRQPPVPVRMALAPGKIAEIRAFSLRDGANYVTT